MKFHSRGILDPTVWLVYILGNETVQIMVASKIQFPPDELSKRRCENKIFQDNGEICFDGLGRLHSQGQNAIIIEKG